MKIIKQIAHDTLKKTSDDGQIRWDWSKLTIFSSFVMANVMAIYSLIAHGFRFDVFFIYIAVAITGKIPSEYSKTIRDKNKTQ